MGKTMSDGHDWVGIKERKGRRGEHVDHLKGYKTIHDNIPMLHKIGHV